MTGANLVLTPECANIMEARPAEKARKIVGETPMSFVAGVRDLARELKTAC